MIKIDQLKDKDCQNGFINKPQLYVVYKSSILNVKTHRLRVYGWRKIHHVNTNQKKARVATLISNRADFKARGVIRDKEVQYVVPRGSILQEDITILIMYTPNKRVSNCVKQKK